MSLAWFYEAVCTKGDPLDVGNARNKLSRQINSVVFTHSYANGSLLYC